MSELIIRPICIDSDYHRCQFCSCSKKNIYRHSIGNHFPHMGFLFCNECRHIATNFIQKFILNGYGNANIFRNKTFRVITSCFNGNANCENGWILDEEQPFVYNSGNPDYYEDINDIDDTQPIISFNPNWDTVCCINPKTGYKSYHIINILLQINPDI